MIKTNRKFDLFTIISSVVLILLWITVFFVHGLIGAVSWAFLKIALPVLGFAFFLFFIGRIICLKIKQKPTGASIANLLISILMMAHFLILINVIPMAYPIQAEKTTPSLTIQSPLTEDAIIGWGGENFGDNTLHAMWAAERWAYDIVMDPYNTGSNVLMDFGIWEKDVVAPVNGVVVAVSNNEEDIEPGTTEYRTAEGNYVYIKVEETGTYLLLNHLKKNSIIVEEGQKVKVGDYLGQIGNSGSTSEPHLHIQHVRQDPSKTIIPFYALEGLPLYFTVDNESVMPRKGELLNAYDG